MSEPKMPPAPPPPAARTAIAKPTSTKEFTIGAVEFQPPRIVEIAVEGWGKTTSGAYANKPAILMARGETGYNTLLSTGRVPDVPRMLIETWDELLATVRTLADKPREFKTLVLDALGGFERLCHEHVCARDFGGNWGEQGFIGWQRGYDIAVKDWLILLSDLDRVHVAGLGVLLLSHAKIATFKNPDGPDYDRYVADVHHKTWGVTHKWADAVLFGNFYTTVEKTSPKAQRGKGVGTNERVLYTERRASFDAKNRFGMAECIDIPDDPSQVWNTIRNAIKGDNSNA